MKVHSANLIETGEARITYRPCRVFGLANTFLGSATKPWTGNLLPVLVTLNQEVGTIGDANESIGAKVESRLPWVSKLLCDAGISTLLHDEFGLLHNWLGNVIRLAPRYLGRSSLFLIMASLSKRSQQFRAGTLWTLLYADIVTTCSYSLLYEDWDLLNRLLFA